MCSIKLVVVRVILLLLRLLDYGDIFLTSFISVARHTEIHLFLLIYFWIVEVSGARSKATIY